MKNIFCLSVFAFLAVSCLGQTKQLDLGDKVPVFNLPTQDGKNFSMKDSVGSKILVVFFYPKDENILCTKELCAFSDSIAKFNNAGALVIGIGKTNLDKLKKFHDAHKLKYDLLDDSTGTVLKAFGLKENLFSNRVTYVVDISGKVVFKSYSKADGKKHVQEVLAYLREMKP